MSSERRRDRTEQFERAFLAVRALLGCRDEPLDAPLGSPGAGARQALAGLTRGERPVRATRLAAELAPIARALEARRLP